MKNFKWSVTSVIPTDNYELILTFASGETKIFDFKPLLNDEINQPLRDIRFFKKAHIEFDSVAWSDAFDIDPKYLYEKSDLRSL